MLWVVVLGLAIVSSRPAPCEAALEFQKATGGFGLGGVVDPSWCFHVVDGRIESSCPTARRPVPGIVPFCPHETMSLSRHDLDAGS